MNKYLKVIFNLFFLLSSLMIYFVICNIIFLSIFGMGGIENQAMKNGIGILVIIVPIILTIITGYIFFKMKRKV